MLFVLGVVFLIFGLVALVTGHLLIGLVLVAVGALLCVLSGERPIRRL